MEESSPPLQKRCHVVTFQSAFYRSLLDAVSVELSMKWQAEFVQCNFIAKRVAQTRVAAGLRFS
jgi:hypothetical protein